MQIIHNSGEILKVSNAFQTATAITIGKFEALHRGHSQLIKSTINYVKSHNHNHHHSLVSVVLSFMPHPVQALSDQDYKPLFSTKEQAFLLGKYDIGYWISYPFDKNTAKLTPKDFCKLLLMRQPFFPYHRLHPILRSSQSLWRCLKRQ